MVYAAAILLVKVPSGSLGLTVLLYPLITVVLALAPVLVVPVALAFRVAFLFVADGAAYSLAMIPYPNRRWRHVDSPFSTQQQLSLSK